MIELCVVILVCSLVQSVFGVGLLVFGTPALLFLGHSFPSALFHLLPCSILIGSLQLHDDFAQTRGMLKDYVVALAPAVAVGAAVVLGSDLQFDVRFAVGLMLLFSASLRFFERFQRKVANYVASNLKSGLALIGFVHGMTNMGGGLLTAGINALFIEKVAVRANIALGYWIMAVIQFGLLLCLQGPQNSWGVLSLLLGISVTAYWTIGRRVFYHSTQLVYQHSMTALMVLCGGLLLKQYAG